MDELPFDERHVPRAEIDWERSAWWWRPLTRAIGPAMKMLALILGAIGVWLAQVGIAIAYWLFRPQWSGLETSAAPTPGAFESVAVEWIVNIAQAVVAFDAFGLRELAFSTFSALWLATVLALVGGILARRSLVELGQQTIAPWGESLRIVFGRWASFLWSTGMHLVGLAFLLLPVLLFGAVSRLGAVGATIGGICLLLAFPFVFAVGRMALSMFLSFPLSTCAIVAEKNADAFEGFSRANAYLFQRPAVVVMASLILFLVGLIGEQIVYWTLTLGWSFMQAAFMLGGAGQTTSPEFTEIGSGLVATLIRAFWFSYFWSASAAVYLILRKSVDHTEFDDLDAIVNPIEKTLPEIPTSPPTGQTTSKGEGASDSQPVSPTEDKPPPA